MQRGGKWPELENQGEVRVPRWQYWLIPAPGMSFRI
jgi:hypothetical protein